MTTADAAALGCAALLAGLPGMGPNRLRALLDRWDPLDALRRATSGQESAVEPALGATAGDWRRLVQTWAGAGGHLPPPPAVAAAHEAAGVSVLLRDDPRYPPALAADIEPPAVLFAHGRLAALEHPRVAVVGTRRCTGGGAGVARELANELAGQGVAIVSGLALGIDGAAHRGVLDARAADPAAAPPVGVVGCGLDIAYPARHRDLHAEVQASGVLLGEAPLATRPAAWRFPARNRIIAALADVVVVVESHAVGGSLHTVTEAERRGIPVMATPGSVRSPATAGTNGLIADGCHPARDATDVLVALGLSAASRRSPTPRRPSPDAVGQTVLDAFGWEPATLDHLAVRTSLALPELSMVVEALLGTGWIQRDGGWYERAAP